MKEDEMGMACGTHGRDGSLYKNILVGKPEEKRSVGSPSVWTASKCVLYKHDGNVWIGFFWLRIWLF
jgi:hypothetical protein